MITIFLLNLNISLTASLISFKLAAPVERKIGFLVLAIFSSNKKLVMSQLAIL
jgi:hypothetical protein